jgi:hypothetical protein
VLSWAEGLVLKQFFQRSSQRLSGFTMTKDVNLWTHRGMAAMKKHLLWLAFRFTTKNFALGMVDVMGFLDHWKAGPIQMTKYDAIDAQKWLFES